jgi:Siderophore synthetase component
MTFAKLQINQTQWRRAGQRLIEMAIAEFLYEEIIQIQPVENNTWQLNLDDKTYQFEATQFLLGHWRIVEGSVRELSESTAQPAWNLHEFIRAFQIKLK